MIWYLSYPISVLEKIYGFKAMEKSKVLIKGKKGTTMGIVLVFIVLEIPIIAPKILEQLVGVVLVREAIWYRIFCVVWSTLITLFALVNQSVFYFVCKPYHHDNIEKPLLVDNLKGYLGEYVPIKIEIK
ncbi:uncharacterized protein LOC130823231 [Amaranthus tricolor]|uniref:uncharacterized protein LOC130823231 n=1 Tax=Amaranthus tricolor TaxID=29722 RepID=UPI00258D2655|nr:uncharacterized protein LOC130823231 [Amaranthus tricolor]